MQQRITMQAALTALVEQAGPPYRSMFRHDTLEALIYHPLGSIGRLRMRATRSYVVLDGHGQFVCGDSRRPFRPGELLFVPAGVEHLFEDFDENFSAWVIFYGPRGGEPH